ncbi:MAG: hypothetical protein LQ345_001424 [Seirophora villosa]|nr:MAG: hypothetical protein LQ345_001424 [Seirophora villosa]
MKSYNIPFDPVQLAERSLPNYTTAPDFRLLPCAIDEAARLQPTKPFASIPVTTDIRDGFRDVSFGQLGNAINRATAWLEENNCQSEPLAYLAPSDLRHIILAVAAVKVGCNMLLLSPRNSPEGNLHLLESVQCTTILTPHASLPGLSAIIEQRTMRTITVPGIHEWLAGTPAIPRPFSKSFGDMRHKPFVIVHSSGSTGLPKPIALTHGFYAAMKSLIETPHPESIYNNILRGGRLFNGFPFFHAGGLFFPFVLSLYFDIPVVLPPVGQPLSAEATDLIYQYGDVQSSCLPPAILQGLVKKAQSLQRLRRMRFIITGGALLPKSFGDAVRSAGTEVYNMIASTESGMMQHLAVGQDEWEYMRFGQQSGVEFKPHSDGLYEMVIVRKQALGGQQAVFELFPDIDSFSTKDLFSPHPNPQKSDFWLCQGRIDDVLVLLNAEKVNPTTMEMVIESSPDVKSALVMGQDRFQTCLLLDPMSEEATGSPGATQTFLDNAWPYVEQANRGSPSHARILRPLLFVTTPSKPMCRTSKGTVNRRQTTKLYAEEVDSLYQEHKLETVLVQSRHSTELMPVTLTRASLRTIVAQTLGLKRDDFAEESNFFASGMDSLLVLELIRSINHALGKISIDPGDIYMNPTLADLWSFIQSMNRNHTAPPSTDRASRMRKVLDGFALDLPLARGKASRVAILTGSTGGLGAYLLRSLIKHAGFSKIYCLNRTAQLPDPKIDLRVEYLRCDFSEPHFGLQAHVYSELLHNVTHILHNAWQVDFNLPLECFSNHLQGVRNFIDFAANSSRSAHIFFISSVASVLNGVADTVEEKVFNDFDMAQPMGYGESKHIAERLLYRAGLESNVSSSICRVGQIAGPVYSTGTWNKREWLPSMIASSKYLNCIPCALGPMDRIDWVPIDAVSQVAVELFTMNRHAGTPTTQVFHLVNPSETYWSELLPTVHGHLGAEDMPVVSLVEWVQRLKATISFTKDIERNPAVKLIDFFSGRVQSNASPIMETKLSVQYSQTLRRLDKISPDQMRLWMEQWSF